MSYTRDFLTRSSFTVLHAVNKVVYLPMGL